MFPTEVTNWDALFVGWPPSGRSVVVVGCGRIGGRVAFDLAKDGIHVLLVDNGLVENKNIRDQLFDQDDVDRPKAHALANRLRAQAPDGVEVRSLHADFLDLPRNIQQRLAASVELVVAATDNHRCQRRINEVCLAAEVDGVYPGIWDRPHTRPGEVGEVIWVLPGRNTPCYLCITHFRPDIGEVVPRRDARWNDCTPLVYATVQTVRALIDFNRLESSWLVPPRHRARQPPPNRLIVHDTGPVSDSLIADGIPMFDLEHPHGIRCALTNYWSQCPHCGEATEGAAERPTRPLGAVPLPTLPRPTSPSTQAPPIGSLEWAQQLLVDQAPTQQQDTPSLPRADASNGWRLFLTVIVIAVVIGALLAWRSRTSDQGGDNSTSPQDQSGPAAPSSSVGVRWEAALPGAVEGIAGEHVVYSTREVLGAMDQSGGIAWEITDLPGAGSGSWPVVGLDSSTIVLSVNGQLVGIDAATGQTRWTQADGSSSVSTATVVDGVLLQRQPSGLYAYDMHTGVLLWQLDGRDVALHELLSDPIVGDGTFLYAIDDAEDSVALDKATGRPVWSASSLSGLVDSIFVDDTRLFVFSWVSDWLVALDKSSGQVLWSFEPPEDESGYSPDPAVAVPSAGSVFFLGTAVFELDRETGAVIEQSEQLGATYQAHGSSIFVATDHQVQIRDSQTGTTTGSFSCGSSDAVRSLTLSDAVALCQVEDGLGVFDAKTGRNLFTHRAAGLDGDVWLSSDGQTAFVETDYGERIAALSLS